MSNPFLLVLVALVICLSGCSSTKEVADTPQNDTADAMPSSKPDFRPEGPVYTPPDLERMEVESRQMIHKLELSAEQKQAFDALTSKYAQLYQSVQKKFADDPANLQDRMMALQSEQENEFRALLTPDQFQTYMSLKEQQGGRW